MTHTPASGPPFGPVTTPTMSSPSVTGAGSIPLVWHPDCASAIAAVAAIKKVLTFIRPSARVLIVLAAMPQRRPVSLAGARCSRQREQVFLLQLYPRAF